MRRRLGAGGENVSSMRVGQVCGGGHPDVDRVAVVGWPAEKWRESSQRSWFSGQGASTTEEDLIRYGRGQLFGV